MRRKSENPSPLTMMERLYVYALHGFLIEVLFTAACTFVKTRQWSLIGIIQTFAFYVVSKCLEPHKSILNQRLLKFRLWT
jgi:hypothetical protein